MKRSPELVALSRDHHQALEAALRLRRASDETLGSAVGHFLEFWSRHGEQHFVIEERLVLPALPDDDAEWAEATRQVRAEHREIRAGAASLADASRSVRPVESVSCLRHTCDLRSGRCSRCSSVVSLQLPWPIWVVRSPPPKPDANAPRTDRRLDVRRGRILTLSP